MREALASSGRVGIAWLAALGTAAILALAAVPALAAPGDLDPKFSRNGKVRTHVGSNASAVTSADAALQSNGKTVVAGTTNWGSSRSAFTVVRYRTNGKLDRSFADDGVQMTRVAPYYVARAIALQDGGKVIVVGDGSGDPSRRELALVRYRAGGSLDDSFGGDGIVTTSFSPGEPGARGALAADVAMQPDGRILVAGGSDDQKLLARYLPDGELDLSFSGNGFVVEEGRYSAYGAVALQPDGKILAGGSTPKANPNYTDLVLSRYESDGAQDLSFSGDGVVTHEDDLDTDLSAGVIVPQPDGRLLVAGTYYVHDIHPYGGTVLLRYQPNGQLDTAFADQGERRIGDLPAGLAVQPSGKLLLGGEVGDFFHSGDEPTNFRVMRFDSAGDLDPSFGRSGVVQTRLTGASHQSATLLQPKGRVLLVGHGNGDFILARYKLRQGRHDADADGVRDGNDACPATFGKKRNGCPRRKR